MTYTLALLSLALFVVNASGAATINHSPRPLQHTTRQAANNTADSDTLKTWWHSSGEINTRTPVANDNVRQSHLYSVQVMSTADTLTWYDSFVYETIPRSGKGKLCRPDESTICGDEDDGISIEYDIGATMAWSQFLYGGDVTVKVERPGGSPIAAQEDVIIRPTNLDPAVTVENGVALIFVPYTPDTNGIRFSVEFVDDIWEYRNLNAEGGPNTDEQSHYVQNVNSSGMYYEETYTDEMPVIGREPLNALLIFASPFPANDMIPSVGDETTHQAQPGLVTGLDAIDKSTVYFGPGVYYFTGSAHGVLSESVNWVFLAPGAFVKGAFQYSHNSSDLKASGFGVLSGEQYVFQANTADNYSNSKSDTESLKMWRGDGVVKGQKWTMNGLTTSAQPFNSMDFYGDTDDFSFDVSDYKQVGSFFTQTDGLEMYPGSTIRDVFYHIGDDGIKVYYPDVNVQRLLVWKTNNAPIVQLGWYPRQVSNVVVDNMNVIHCRYYSYLDYAPRALIGSSSSYLDTTVKNTADTSKTLSNFIVSNIRSEGLSPALISLNMLTNIDDFLIENVWIEEFVPLLINVSTVTGFTDGGGQKVSLGANSAGGIGMRISNYSVGNEHITLQAGNWDRNSLGGLNFDQDYDGKWTLA
ncbi:MAG: hypothetical protein MMC23_007638 [Stictis urceolatum]|nr:hypothetical protein [Stictis urceolata]